MPAQAQQLSKSGSRRRLVVLVLSAALLQILVVYLRIKHTYYIADDFLNFEIYRQQHFTRAYLLRDVFGQLLPGYRAGQALVFKAFGLNYLAALTIICALSAGSLVMMILIGVRLGASTALIIAICLPFIFQLQMTHAELWWAASLASLPGLFATLLGLWFLIGRDGKPNDDGAIAGALCFAAGLMFFSKVVFSAAIYFGVLLFLRQRERPVSELFKNARAAIWQLRFVILVALGWAIVVNYLTNALGAPKPPLSVIIETLWKSLSDGTLAAMLGLGTNGALLFGSYEWTIVATFAVFATIVIATFWSAGPAAAILWACNGLYLVAAMGTIALTRAPAFGSDTGRWLRYNIENATFLLLLLLVACAASSSSRGPWSRLGSITGIAFAIALSANLIVQSRNLKDHGDVAAARAYVTALTRSLREIAGRQNVTLADGPVPQQILSDWMGLYPYNQLRYFITLFPSAPPVVPSDQATHRLDGNGSIVPR
jgi:hypothetical protein